MKRKQYTNGNGLKWKVLMLIGGVILLIVLLIFQVNGREKEKREYEKSVRQTETQDKEQETEKKPDKSKDEAANEQEIGEEKEKQKLKTQITNLEEYATELMGENTRLLEERLAEWIEENQLSAKKGIIFHVMIPESDPQSINFYIRLKNKKNSLVMLSYHPRENVVTASRCNYTEEEIKNEVWEDNGPAQRDVPAETESENPDRQQEELNDTSGET